MIRLLAILLSVSFAQADETPAKPIRLPVIDNVQPVPVTPPQPKPVTTLPEDHFFVVESDVRLIVLHSPDGVLQVEEETGPIRLRGKFAGSTGKVESKTFAGPFVYVIESAKAGTTELILIPSGVTSSDQIVRTMLSVRGAQPPPDDDKDKPEPGPTPTPTSDIHIDIWEDSLNRSVETATTLNALLAWSGYMDAGNSFRIWDKNNNSDKAKAARKGLDDAALPAMVIRDKATSQVLRVVELPKDFDSLKRVLSEFGVK